MKPAQIQYLQEALSDCFSRADLKEFVFYHFSEDLSNIVSEKENDKVAFFEFIKWIREKQLLHAESFELHARFSEQSWAIADIINVMSTICFAYLFCIMDMKTVSTKEKYLPKETFYNTMLVIVLTAACFLVFSILDRFFHLGNLDGAGTLVYSFLTSIAMLYFFGRLDSHLFEAKRSLLAPLYLYAVIQVNWTNFRSAEFATQGLIIFFVAFLLKIYFFFIVNGWLRNGDFARYFARIRVLQKDTIVESNEEKEVVMS